MRPSYLVLSVLAIGSHAASAQSFNLDSIVSEVYSVYTQVTSIWASDASAASVQATATDGSSSSPTSSLGNASSTGSNSAASSISATSSASDAIAQNSGSQTGSAAAASASSLASSGHGTNHKTLAIVLGCVLGALVLGLLILAFLLCCRRRNRGDRSDRNVHSPDDDEVESWRNGGSGDSRVAGAGGGLLGHHHNRDGVGAVAGPNMTEHPAYRNQNHDNPFVPTPPPARRTAPISRAGLTDEARPGEQPYLTDPKTGTPLSSDGSSNGIHKNDHHKVEAIAAGLGGAGAAAALMHHRHKKEDEKFAREHGRDGIRDDGLHSHHKTTNSTDGTPTTLYSERHLGDAGGDPNVISSHHHHTGEVLGGMALGGAALTGGRALHRHHDENNGTISPDHDGNRLRGDNARLGHNSEKRSDPAPISGGGTENRPEHDHHKAEALAATAGVGALAAAGMHHHHKKDDEKMAHERERDLLDASSPNDSHNQLSPTAGIHDAQQGDHHKGEALAAGLGGVGLTGAAAAHHRRENEKLGHDREDEGNLLAVDRSSNQHNLSNLPANTGDINDNNNNHHKGEALVAGGLATGLVGAAAVHHHHQKKEDEAIARNHEHGLLRDNSLQHRGSITRKPVGSTSSSAPISPITPVESQHISRPFPTPTTNDDAYAFNKVPSRRSGESARRLSLGRDRPAVLGNVGDAYSVPYDSTQRNLRQPDTYGGPRKSLDGNGNHKSHVPLLVGGAAGVATGAALANHRNRKSSKSRSPHRHSFIGLGDKKRDSNSDHSTSTTNSSGSYDDAVPVQTAILAQRPLSGAETRDVTAEIPEDVPPAPLTRSRRNSALGSGAPSAAVGSYMNQSLSQQGSGNGPPLTQKPGGAVPPMPVMGSGGSGNTAYGWGNGYKNGQRVAGRRDQTPPAVPSRSPRRARFSDVPFDPEEDAAIGTGRKGLVGDNGYPHMGLQSRRSGDDFETIVPVRNEGPAPGLRPSLDGQRDSGKDTSSEDSTWRLSSGMPGGWRKDGRTASMGSQGAKRTSGGWFSRDSGVAGLDGSRSGSMTSASGVPAGNGRRLRLSDLKREEEEKERERGRRSMGAEWSGNGGYDGYEGGGIGGGVGQAL